VVERGTGKRKVEGGGRSSRGEGPFLCHGGGWKWRGIQPRIEKYRKEERKGYGQEQRRNHLSGGMNKSPYCFYLKETGTKGGRNSVAVRGNGPSC